MKRIFLLLLCAGLLLSGCGAPDVPAEPARSAASISETAPEEPVASTQPELEKPAASTQPKLEKPAASTQPELEKPAASTQPELEKPAASTQPELEKPVASTQPEPEEDTSYQATLCFAGDVCLAEGQYVTDYWENTGKDISQCISETLLEHMRGADIMMLNNEFTYSNRGEPMEGKAYTYRADPSNVSALSEMGVDIVSLANNHVYDYGAEALEDTLDTLSNADIPYVGAGRNLEEASAISYAEVGKGTIAFLSGSRVEWDEQTKGAGADSPGVFRTVDPELLYQQVAEARKQADYVVVYMHWGMEHTTDLEEYQVDTAKGLIDAGADAVIGDHPHVLQGMTYYKGKPVVYSMGNYWFNSREQDTMLLELHITGDASGSTTEVQVVPGYTHDCQTTYVDDADSQRALYDQIEAWSNAQVSIDEDGMVTERLE